MLIFSPHLLFLLCLHLRSSPPSCFPAVTPADELKLFPFFPSTYTLRLSLAASVSAWPLISIPKCMLGTRWSPERAGRPCTAPHSALISSPTTSLCWINHVFAPVSSNSVPPPLREDPPLCVRCHHHSALLLLPLLLLMHRPSHLTHSHTLSVTICQ